MEEARDEATGTNGRRNGIRLEAHPILTYASLYRPFAGRMVAAPSSKVGGVGRAAAAAAAAAGTGPLRFSACPSVVADAVSFLFFPICIHGCASACSMVMRRAGSMLSSERTMSLADAETRVHCGAGKWNVPERISWRRLSWSSPRQEKGARPERLAEKKKTNKHARKSQRG